MSLIDRFLARQFARPGGWIGRMLIGPWLNRISRSMNRLVLERLHPGGDEDALEIGFGGGDLLAALLSATRGTVHGADISEAMIARASVRFRKEVAAGRLRLHQASIEKLPLETASVDLGASVNNIYFWPDPEAGMAELARVIRPGGRAAIAFEPPEELRKWPGHIHGFRLFEPDEVADLLEAAGFEAIETAEGHGRKPDRFLVLTGRRSSR